MIVKDIALTLKYYFLIVIVVIVGASYLVSDSTYDSYRSTYSNISNAVHYKQSPSYNKVSSTVVGLLSDVMFVSDQHSMLTYATDTIYKESLIDALNVAVDDIKQRDKGLLNSAYLSCTENQLLYYRDLVQFGGDASITETQKEEYNKSLDELTISSVVRVVVLLVILLFTLVVTIYFSGIPKRSL